MKKKADEWTIEGLVKKNAVTVMQFSHDDWCNKMKDMSKECNCDPEITFSEIKEEDK